MYLPAGQHPYLAVLDPKTLNALSISVRVFHLLPHNVRLNPLSLNTENHQQQKMEKEKKIKK